MKAIVLISILVLFGCSANKLELDPAKVQSAITQLQLHIVEVEKKLGIVYPAPVVTPAPTIAPVPAPIPESK